MPRRGHIKKIKVPADSVYGSILAQRFINKLMIQGKKSDAGLDLSVRHLQHRVEREQQALRQAS